jgi:hypothetical protein
MKICRKKTVSKIAILFLNYLHVLEWSGSALDHSSRDLYVHTSLYFESEDINHRLILLSGSHLLFPLPLTYNFYLRMSIRHGLATLLTDTGPFTPAAHFSNAAFSFLLNVKLPFASASLGSGLT